jgi:hypothetical protein
MYPRQLRLVLLLFLAWGTVIRRDWSCFSRCPFFSFLAINLDLSRTEIVDEYLKQKKELKKDNINFVLWDHEKLVEFLKESPEIVDDFFDIEWTKLFNGLEAASNLEKTRKMTKQEIIEFRKEYYKFNLELFQIRFSLLPREKTTELDLPIEERIVIPDINAKYTTDDEDYEINQFTVDIDDLPRTSDSTNDSQYIPINAVLQGTFYYDVDLSDFPIIESINKNEIDSVTFDKLYSEKKIEKTNIV